ncbi:ABC transporter ATP-binding protein [Tsukamurella spumae]|uniref:ABC transporter ATP-binding protein n=1 Tax=Tsukamurella spumae TaxID=44753 RepID=A0A846X1M3_9ACTN|nr:ABC transporter ATP-binding protein [Tsukamurella spumae]NKY18405.1 ABC transporter ATP-binding protein [Tsukamurella spumae]
MISVQELRVHRARRPVLQDVTLTVPDGAVTYLLGRNGAGKSTLLRAVAGLLRPSAGTVDPGGSIGLHLGPDAAAPAHTVHRHLRWVAAGSGCPPARVDVVIRDAGLGEVAGARIGALSLGWRQRVAVAAALLPDAGAVVFDEPLNGLDIDAALWFRGVLTRLAARGASVLVASHHLDEALRTGDRLAVLEGGRIVAEHLPGDFADGAAFETAYLRAIGTAA